MSVVERLAAQLQAAPDDPWPDYSLTASEMAQLLVDAGWHDGPKLTDADRAVLDAAKAWRQAFIDAETAAPGDEPFYGRELSLIAAVDRLAEARRETQP